MTVHPFWGATRPELYDLLQACTDPEGRILAAVAEECPWMARDILEVGCGRGDFARLAAREAGRVAAVEPDVRLLARARDRVPPDAGVELLRAGAERLPFPDDSFDAVYAFWSYFFGAGCEPGIREARRVLRPGGTLCVVQNYGRDALSTLWSEAEFRCLAWPEWFRARGFALRVVSTRWSFPDADSAVALVSYLWGHDAAHRLMRARSLDFEFKAALFFKSFEIRPHM